MAAVRVPPSACSTSQSSVMVRSPSSLAVDAGAQRAADQALDFQRAPALLAARGFAVAARVRGSRQHAVLRGDPAFALAAQERRDLVLHAGGAQHARLAEADQDRTFGMAGIAALDADLAHLRGRATAGTRYGGRKTGGRGDGRAGHGLNYRFDGRASLPFAPCRPSVPALDSCMIRSMTAFASGERATPWGTLGCELRSVNHRFLELGVRLPDELRALEPALRERVAGRVARGKVDLTLRLRAPEGERRAAAQSRAAARAERTGPGPGVALPAPAHRPDRTAAVPRRAAGPVRRPCRVARTGAGTAGRSPRRVRARRVSGKAPSCRRSSPSVSTASPRWRPRFAR